MSMGFPVDRPVIRPPAFRVCFVNNWTASLDHWFVPLLDLTIQYAPATAGNARELSYLEVTVSLLGFSLSCYGWRRLR